MQTMKRNAYSPAIPWGLTQRLKIQSPMLCCTFQKLSRRDQNNCLDSPAWIAERKFDGCRVIIAYHPREGFTFFSRNCLDYTAKILLNGRKGSDFVGCFPESFILDGEVFCDTARIDTTAYRGGRGVITETPLAAVISVLESKTSNSHEIQRQQAPLRLAVFDVLEIEDRSLVTEPLRKRLKARRRIISQLAGTGIIEVDSCRRNETKREFYTRIIAEGGEGIVLKNLDSPYIATGARPKTGFVKYKPSIDELLDLEFDSLISSFQSKSA